MIGGLSVLPAARRHTAAAGSSSIPACDPVCTVAAICLSDTSIKPAFRHSALCSCAAKSAPGCFCPHFLACYLSVAQLLEWIVSVKHQRIRSQHCNFLVNFLQLACMAAATHPQACACCEFAWRDPTAALRPAICIAAVAPGQAGWQPRCRTLSGQSLRQLTPRAAPPLAGPQLRPRPVPAPLRRP